MTVTSLRFKEEHYKQIQDLAKFYGVSVAEFIQQTILDRIHDENDYKSAVENIKKSHGKTVPREATLRRLDLK